MTQRTAHMDLEWEKVDGSLYQAPLPPIPGYPDEYGPSHVQVFDATLYDTWVSLPPSQEDLEDGRVWTFKMDFGFMDGPYYVDVADLAAWAFNTPLYGASADEMMDAVEGIDPDKIALELSRKGVEPSTATASRKATRRTASLNLEWDHLASGDWMADLPAIPGYTGTTGNYSFVTVGPSPTSEDWVCSFTIFVPGKGQAYLSNRDLDIPDAVTGEEMVAAVDALSPEDIADALEALGYEQPGGVVASRQASRRTASVAARHASKHTAHMDLNWMEGPQESYTADLPYLPDYPDSYRYNDFILVAHNPQNYDVWEFMVCVHTPDNQMIILGNEEFGIPDGTADEMMDAVENLDTDDIERLLAEKDYMPVED